MDFTGVFKIQRKKYEDDFKNGMELRLYFCVKTI